MGHAPAPSSDEVALRRVELLRRHGVDPIACSTLQPGLSVFETEHGYVAHRRALGSDITLGPPVCAPEHRPALLDAFLRGHRQPLWCYVEADLLRELQEHGHRLHAAGMGVDKQVDLDALLRSPPREIAAAARKARREGFDLDELSLDGITPDTRARIGEITRAFVGRGRVQVEMAFLNRPMSLRPDGLRRVFVLRTREAGVFGYVVLNPYFTGGRVVGYLLDIVRFERTRLWGVYLATVLALARRLADEGHELSLGLCPLAQVAEPPHLGSRVLQTQVRWLERSLREVEYLQRLHHMKSLVPGPWRPRYFASHSRNAIRAVATLVVACGVSLRSIVGPDLVRSVVRSRDAQPSAPAGATHARS